ncbi:MAG: PLD nuclease N-terminal domain-containing protein [Candidatus Heimdallarchaeota archaeon]
MSIIQPELIPLIIPLIVIELSLKAYCLLNIRRSIRKTRSKKIGWAIIVCVISLIGPVLYLFAGREVD